MSGFKDIRFPTAISFDAVGGPGFLTNIVFSNSGKEFRDQIWELERGEWEVSHAITLPTAYKAFQAFFRIVRGRAYSFRYKDWSDFVCDVGDGLFIDTDDSPPAKQMVKRYTFGSETFDRVITKPCVDKITTDAASLDYATGIAVSGTTWSGEFDCHARLDTDKMKQELVDRSGGEIVITWASIPILEVKG